MKSEEYLLVKLNEECLEVAHRVSKALCFGLSEVQKGQSLTNAQRIVGEFADLLGVYEMLIENGTLEYPTLGAIDAKKAKVRKYLEYSRTLGIVK